MKSRTTARAWALQARAAVPAVAVSEGGRAGLCLASGAVAVRGVPGRSAVAPWPRVRAALRGLLPPELPAEAAPLRGRWRVESAESPSPALLRVVLSRRCGRVDLRATVEARGDGRDSPTLGGWSCAWEVSRRPRGRSSGAPAATGGGGWPEAIGGAWRAALELEGAACAPEGLSRRGASPGAAAQLARRGPLGEPWRGGARGARPGAEAPKAGAITRQGAPARAFRVNAARPFSEKPRAWLHENDRNARLF